MTDYQQVNQGAVAVLGSVASGSFGQQIQQATQTALVATASGSFGQQIQQGEAYVLMVPTLRLDQLEALPAVVRPRTRIDQVEALPVVERSKMRIDHVEAIVVVQRTSDMLGRLKMVMPPWFGQPRGQATPVLDGFLSGPARALDFVKNMVAFVKAQTRLSTMSGGFLDLFAQDYFGTDLLRKTDEADDTYRARITAEFFHASNTEAAILAAIAEVATATPTVVKWWDPSATGVWRNGAKTVWSAYWNVNTAANPARWTGPGVWIEIAVSDQETRRLLFVALRRYKAAGVKIYLKFTA